MFSPLDQFDVIRLIPLLFEDMIFYYEYNSSFFFNKPVTYNFF